MKRKNLLTLFSTAVMSTALLGCSTDATSPVARVPKPSFGMLDGLAVPELRSAVLAGANQGFSIVRLTFLDTADNEALVSAQFAGADGSVMTASIAGTPGMGERVVDVYAPKNVTTARLNYMFRDPSYGTTCGCLFGSYSATATVTNGSAATTPGKAKGHK